MSAVELATEYYNMEFIADKILADNPSIDFIVMKTDDGRVILLSDPDKV